MKIWEGLPKSFTEIKCTSPTNVIIMATRSSQEKLKGNRN